MKNYPSELINESGIIHTSSALYKNHLVFDFKNICEWIGVNELFFMQEIEQYRKFDYDIDNFMDHWLSIRHLYPNLYRCAEVIAISKISSADVERSFSKFRVIDADNRQSMSDELKNMLNVLYFNK